MSQSTDIIAKEASLICQIVNTLKTFSMSIKPDCERTDLCKPENLSLITKFFSFHSLMR